MTNRSGIIKKTAPDKRYGTSLDRAELRCGCAPA
jgi:hypothetical protein